MDNSRFLECLEADYRRIREVVPGHLEARVPTCPDWTVDDLTWHLGMVYLHKATGIQQGAEPEQWPPPYDDDDSAIELIDNAYRQLLDQFAVHKPEDATGTWYGPDQTVGFWIRRMAQESVIHRIDAELGADAPVSPVPDDLAVDGIDELLKVFVAYSVTARGDLFTEALANSPGRTYKIQTTPTADTPAVTWQIKTSPGRFTVKGGPDEKLTVEKSIPDVTISGTPTDVLRWSWNRETPGTPSRVRIGGTPEAPTELQRCIVIATQ